MVFYTKGFDGFEVDLNNGLKEDKSLSSLLSGFDSYEVKSSDGSFIVYVSEIYSNVNLDSKESFIPDECSSIISTRDCYRHGEERKDFNEHENKRTYYIRNKGLESFTKFNLSVREENE